MRPFSRCLVRVKWAIYIQGFKNPSQILVLLSYITVRYQSGKGGDIPPYFANPKETLKCHINKCIARRFGWLFNVP